MIAAVRELARQQRDLDSRVRALGGQRVTSHVIRTAGRDLVDFYFREARPTLAAAGFTDSELAGADSDLHALLESTHKSGSKSVYRRILRSVASQCLAIEKTLLQRGDVTVARTAAVGGIDATIVDTLRELVPSAALSYEQAVRDLTQAERLSWRGPATDMREALRETLDHLAPDKEVLAQSGFKLERDTSGPTMKQKVRYVLRKRGISRSGLEAPEAAVQAVDEAVGAFVRSAYTRSNISTHTPTDRREVIRVRDLVRVALSELLELQT